MMPRHPEDFGDLFERRYPQTPGYKRPDTSKEAAERVKAKAPNLRMRVYLAIKHSDGLTADEVARKIGHNEFGVRPRLSELHNTGRIEKLEEERRINDSGATAAVWVATQEKRT